jgi:hypothetical protein
MRFFTDAATHGSSLVKHNISGVVENKIDKVTILDKITI